MQEQNQNNKRLKNARKFFFVVLFFICFYAIFLIGYISGQKGFPLGIGPRGVRNIEIGKQGNVDFSLFWEAWNLLKTKAVSEPENNDMVDGAISGLLSSTDDPYTVYLTKKENQRFREDIGGEFSGIGIEITQKDNVVTIVAPLADTPADKAGIKAGDIIEEVDGVKTADIGYEETVNRIRGKEGTVVKLKIIRAQLDEPSIFEVTRATIKVKSVTSELRNVSGKQVEYIKISQFGDDTESLFNDVANQILKENPSGIVIDLRNNPGGYLETAVNLASYFVKDGVIVSEKGRNNSSKDYKSTGTGRLADFKVVVLVNNGSASASEIFAGALQDRLGVKIIGEKTFGKGSVQELIDLSNGSAVKITVAKWYTPSGRQINGEGLEPDIKVEQTENEEPDVQLNKAMECLLN